MRYLIKITRLTAITMPANWQILNGVKYPVDPSPTQDEGEEETHLPRSYWRAKEGQAATTIQKYARRMINPLATENRVDTSHGGMDAANAKATKILFEEGGEAAVSHMFTRADGSSRSYSEMRSIYG
jgi:hypothetical protein